MQKILLWIILMNFIVACTLKSPRINVGKPMNSISLFKSTDSIFVKYGYLAALDSLLIHRKYFENEPYSRKKSIYFQVLSTQYSQIGDLENTLKADSIAIPTKWSNTTYICDTSIYKAVNAKKAIIENLKNKQILLINERHNSPQNRAFIRDLLPDLYEIGFRYLAVEALSNEDTLIANRGFPVINTGYYIREPIFGQEIRNALSLGFKLVPIDNIEPDLKDKIPNSSNDREISQANQIFKILGKNSAAKIIVHSGYDHIFKKSHYGINRMAYYLNEYLSTKILSVDCVEMQYKLNANPFYKLAIDFFSGEKKPFVLNQKNNKIFCSSNLKDKVDFNIFLPKNYTIFEDISSSFSANKNVKKIKLPINSRNKFISIYLKKEWLLKKNTAIPYLNFVNFENCKFINLPKNNYKIVSKRTLNY